VILPNPPESLCLLRTSALGDVTHVVPLVRTLQDALPATRLTWIIGKLEQRLVGDIAGVEFVTFDKSKGLTALADVRRQLAKRRFDALLHMQVALRANLVSALVRAPLRIGYDSARAKDLHGWFVNRRIPARSGEHVVDAIGSFVEPLGLKQARVRWDIPIPSEAEDFVATHIVRSAPLLLVSPCSSHAARNWLPERYAATIDHASACGWQVALCGGPSAFERAFGDSIVAKCTSRPTDLIGKDTLKQFLALARRADLVLTPDSGPMHMANAVGAKVLGLHAASNPARSGPYSDRRWCVDRYDAAARKFRGKPAAELRWGTKLEHPGVMELIEVDAVIERFDAFAAQRAADVRPDSPGMTFPRPASNPA
jgi:heptosyltransferase I